MTDPDVDQCIICLEPLPPAPPAKEGDESDPTTSNADITDRDADHEIRLEEIRLAEPLEQLIQAQTSAPAPPAGPRGVIVPIFENGPLTASTGTHTSINTTVDGDVDQLQNIASLNGCNHVLHDACIRTWAQKTNTCPICRKPFHAVTVTNGIGGPVLTEYTVEAKKQVAEFDIREWLDQNDTAFDDEEDSAPCPLCASGDNEDRLLLCDGCNAAYHTYCIGFDAVPEGHWYCMECIHNLDLTPEQAAVDVDDLAEGHVPQPHPQPHPHHHPHPHPHPHLLHPHLHPQPRRTGSGRPPRAFPRTRGRVRSARQQARSFDWQGPWGEIAGRVFDGLDIDLDNPDDDEALQHFRRSQQRSSRERREYQRWQQRLNIASRLGAREVFSRTIPRDISEHLQEPPVRSEQQVQEERTERRAWGAFDRAREQGRSTTAAPQSAANRRKRARSPSASPASEPSQEPERKLKRSRTRRLPAQNEPSSSRRVAITNGNLEGPPAPPPPPLLHSPSLPEAPSFLTSLLKEVEMSTPTEEDGPRSHLGQRHVPDPSSPVMSPVMSPMSSPRLISTTPPPFPNDRPSSPTLLLSSHIEPRYPPANYSPNRGADETRLERCSIGRAASPELRQPRPHRRQSIRLPDPSPNRHPALSLEAKSSISNFVRTALRPHWQSQALSSEQYASINRDVSRKLYDEVRGPNMLDPSVLDQDVRNKWEALANLEVARAVAELQS